AAYEEQNPAREGEAPAAPPPSAPPKSAAPAKPGVTRESSLAWDTTAVPDGIYLIKVIASDKASNPSDPLSAEKVSEPVIVVNQPPVLFIPPAAIQSTPDKRVVVTGLCQARVTLKGAQYRVDEGDWQAIDAADGIWDSGLEQWRFTTDPLKPGDHAIQV